MKIERLLCVILILQGLILVSQWTGAPSVQHARADMPDALNTRNTMVDELKAMNTKMDRLIDILNSGNLQVHVAQPDENSKDVEVRPAR